jgi:hypothetical protein
MVGMRGKEITFDLNHERGYIFPGEKNENSKMELRP